MGRSAWNQATTEEAEQRLRDRVRAFAFRPSAFGTWLTSEEGGFDPDYSWYTVAHPDSTFQRTLQFFWRREAVALAVESGVSCAAQAGKAQDSCSQPRSPKCL